MVLPKGTVVSIKTTDWVGVVVGYNITLDNIIRLRSSNRTFEVLYSDEKLEVIS